MDILKPHSKVPDAHTATILIVGSEGTGKHTLAKAMVGVHTSFTIQVRTAKALPLPIDIDDSRPEIDFVIFMINLANKTSMAAVESSVTKLDARYFLGKTCFVVTGTDRTSENCVLIETVSQLVDSYNSVMICDTIETDEGRLSLARKILHLVETAAGFKAGVSPMLVQSTRRPYTVQLT